MYPLLGILIFESVFTILIVGHIVGLLLVLIGYISNIQRFYIYGAIFLGTAFFTFLVPVVLLLPLIVLGAMMVTYGTVLLYRFMRQFPKETFGEVEGV